MVNYRSTKIGPLRMIRVLFVFGTRPEAIKMAPVIRVLAQQPQVFKPIVCVSAQHREMLDQVLELFHIEPQYDLDLMQRDQSPADVASTILRRLPSVLEEAKPDFVLVQGDTITTFAAATCAFLQRIPVGHIEAGLRTGNLDHPFPEEMNRRLTTQLSRLHFAPTTRARDALLAENVNSSNIFVTGNTVIDALLQTVSAKHAFDEDVLNHIGSRRLVLVTTHRRESFGAPLQEICSALKSLAIQKPDLTIVLPVHPNPQVSRTVYSSLSGVENINLIQPLEYGDFVNLMSRSALILTDSGGVQEEAPSLDVPVLVLRETTERPEGTDAGATRLVGTAKDSIIEHALEVLDNPEVHRKMAQAKNPYGDGTASDQIATIIRSFFSANI